jgi:disulfide bond formation protein DsbB
MHLPVTRWIDLFTFFLCALVLAVAVYLQYRVGIIPCPLCIIQRFIITLLGLLFLMGALFNFETATRCFLHTLTFLFAAAGAVVASRQLWLEHFPSDQSISCKAIDLTCVSFQTVFIVSICSLDNTFSISKYFLRTVLRNSSSFFFLCQMKPQI